MSILGRLSQFNDFLEKHDDKIRIPLPLGVYALLALLDIVFGGDYFLKIITPAAAATGQGILLGHLLAGLTNRTERKRMLERISNLTRENQIWYFKWSGLLVFIGLNWYLMQFSNPLARTLQFKMMAGLSLIMFYLSYFRFRHEFVSRGNSS